VSAGSRIVGGLKVVEAEPGAPPPEGVPPWALRCQVEEQPGYPIALQPWILGAGIAGILGGVLTTVYVSHWGFAPVPLSLVVTLLIRHELDGTLSCGVIFRCHTCTGGQHGAQTHAAE
jgi:hypothetical protein